MTAAETHRRVELPDLELPAVAELARELPRQWVCWRAEDRGGSKPTKVPYAPNGRPASSTDPATWSTLVDCARAVPERGFDGLGVVLTAEDPYVGVDLDDAVTPQGVEPWAAAIVERLETYTEVSPSGRGLRLFARGRLPEGRRKRGGVEMYETGRYLTVTGHHLGTAPPTIEERTDALAALHREVFGAGKPNGGGRAHYERRTDGPPESVWERLRSEPRLRDLFESDHATLGFPSESEADQSLANHLAVRGIDGGSIESVLRERRARIDGKAKHDGYYRATVEQALGWAASRAHASDARRARPASEPSPEDEPPPPEEPPEGVDTEMILDPADPLPSARKFVARHHVVDDTLALRHQAGVFFGFDGSAYAEDDEAAIRSRLYAFLEPARRWTTPREGREIKLVPYKPTKSKVENVLDALRAVCNLPASAAPPCWLQDDPGLDPLDLVTCRNGVLHIPSRRLLAPTPKLFSLQALAFDYDPEAPLPQRWLEFIEELWPDDPESQETLQEWVGYLLTPRTHHQKIAMLVGPKRSGKGTIGRVVRRLLGERNVCGPTLSNIGQQFGLATLIGKTLAVISDARISGRTDSAIVVERLLSISGEDALSIPRKYLPDWTGRLPTRFLLLTNELPRIEDASGALASRFIVLALTRSWYGREDPGLSDRFIPELPGILNWALEGWDRLRARGRFVQPATSAELIQQLEDLGSPIAAFLRERCELGAGYSADQHAVFEAWKTWCAANGRERPGTIQVLARNLRAAVPGLRVTRPREEGRQARHWEGLRLKLWEDA